MPAISIKSLQHPVEWRRGPESPVKLTGRADIWRIGIDETLSFRHFLTVDELAGVHRFREAHNQNEFIAARGALRYLSGKYLHTDPLSLLLLTGQNGKPYWAEENGCCLFFNTAHAGDHILIGFSEEEIGIDIEKINNGFDYKGIVSRCYSDTEKDWLYQSQDELRTFYSMWTIKESIIKATGRGVHDDLHAIPSLEGRHTISTELLGDTSNWQITGFTADEDYMAALATGEHVGELHFYEL